MQKVHPEYLLPKRRLSCPQQVPTLNVFLRPKLQRYWHYRVRGRTGYPRVSFPFTGGHGVTCGGHSHPLCCMERGAGRIWAPGKLAQGPSEGSPRLSEVPITWGLSGTAPALEGIPQLTGSTQRVQASGCQKLPSRSRSSCRGGMRQHCALKSIPDPISER